MKPSLLIGLSTAVLIGQEAMPTAHTGWDLVIQGGALGILGFAVIWALTRTIPTLVKSHNEERQQFWERMDRWEANNRDDSRKLNETLENMTAHCRETVSKLDK